jgi:hypothetical protein
MDGRSQCSGDGHPHDEKLRRNPPLSQSKFHISKLMREENRIQRHQQVEIKRFEMFEMERMPPAS